MAKKFDYHLIVIGGGIAGVSAALAAAKYCKAPHKVALIDDFCCAQNKPADWIPGNINETTSLRTLNFCQSSSFVKASSFDQVINVFPKILATQEKQAKFLEAQLQQELATAGVDHIGGSARFLNPFEVIISQHKPQNETCDRKISASHFVLATGSTADLAGIKISKGLRYLTTDNCFSQTPPRTVCIIGGGSSGCTVAQYFAGLGSLVLLIEKQERLLPSEDPEAGLVLSNVFKRQLRNIKVLTQAQVVVVNENNGRKQILTKFKGQEKTFHADSVVFCTGHKPVLPDSLENAQVRYGSHGAKVDRTLQTDNRHIWAIGSCIHADCTPEQAAYQGDLATANALGRQRTLVSYVGFTRLTRTTPQIASLGLNENDCLARQSRRHRKAIVPLSQTLAIATGEAQSGFVKLICNHDYTILGATVVAPQAETLAQEIAFAMRHELTCIEIASTPHTIYGCGAALQLCAKKILANN